VARNLTVSNHSSATLKSQTNPEPHQLCARHFDPQNT
jgi:hypothetical protein